MRTLSIALALVALAPAASRAQDPGAAAFYKRSCAMCHDEGVNRAPARDAFLTMTPERVLAAMETGSMVTMANNRTAAERRSEGSHAIGRAGVRQVRVTSLL